MNSSSSPPVLASSPRWRATLLVCAASAALLSACAAGPNFKHPGPPKGAGYSPEAVALPATAASERPAGAAERFVMGRDIPFAWWKEFGSPKLDALVERALKSNPSITAAQAALRQAHELTTAQRRAYLPNLTANYQFQRQDLAGNTANTSAPGVQGDGRVLLPIQDPVNTPHNSSLLYNFHTAQLSVGFVPDVFGGNRRAVESLKAQENGLRFQMEATYITLVNNVVAAAVQEASVQAEIKATKAFIKTNSDALDILHEQFRLGYVMRIDVAAQESALAQAEALLPPLEKQLEQTHDLIRVLCGAMPNDQMDVAFDLDAFTLPTELPLSLPAQLVNQRPDVKAAEEQWRAAVGSVGVAAAARLPQFNISANDGGTATKFDEMFKAGGPFWNLTSNTTQVVFDGGVLQHRQRAAEQAAIQAKAQYRSTLLTAFQNVADTLHAIKSDADSLRAVARAEEAAKVTRDVTKQQYELGYVNYQTLLTAEGAYQQAVVNRIQAETNRYGDAAALFQALGGGWWNRAKS